VSIFSKARRGATLIFVMLLSLVLLVLGMGFLSQRVAQNRAANLELRGLQARALAEAGLEDARIKLAKRHSFPPLDDLQQTDFRYTETLDDAFGQPAGSYQVRLDTTFADGPNWIARVTSRGWVGPSESPEAENVLFAEIDISEWTRATINRSVYTPNPDRFRVIYLQEGEP
jgi:Tfp pilus assembly protein PilX